MRAARLLPDADSLAVLDVEEPEPSGDQVVVAGGGRGGCAGPTSTCSTGPSPT